MTHLETIETFPDYVAGTLGASRRAQIDDHLSSCPSCRSAFALLKRTLEPGETPQRLTADPFLPTRIREQAKQASARKLWSPVVRWSFASVAFGAALVLGILIGSGLPASGPSGATTSGDLVSEFASSLSTSDLGDQWYSAVGTDEGVQK